MPKLGMEVIRRRQVLEAAISILSNSGWHDLTIREVSEVANVSSGVVTHYFANKRSIVVDAVAETNQNFIRTIGMMEKTSSSMKLRLVAITNLMLKPEAHGIPNHNYWIALYGRLPFDQVIQAELQRLQRWLAECVAKIVRAGLHNGEFQTAAVPEDVADSFVLMAFGQVVTAAASPADLSVDRREDLILNTLGAMLGTELSQIAIATDAQNANIA